MGGDVLRPEGPCILFFVHQLDAADPDIVVIEIKVFRVIDRVSYLDSLADIGDWDLIDGALEADGGIVIDDPFVTDEKDLVQFCFGESSNGRFFQGDMVSIDGFFVDAGMELMVVIVLEPQIEGLIDLIERDAVLYPGEKPIPGRSEKSFDFST